jgi:hypothetical protein
MGVSWSASQTFYWKQAIQSTKDQELCIGRTAEMMQPCIGELKSMCDKAAPCFTFCCNSETKELQPIAACQPCNNALEACSGCYTDSACSRKSVLHFLPKAQSLPPALPYVESASSCNLTSRPPSAVATGSIPGVSVDTTGGESWVLDEKRFPFTAQLDEDRMTLWWSVDTSKAMITFAVRAKTTGWVGIGISPNGKMPGSDIFLGWVSSAGKPIFADRFAAGRSMPVIDSSQDWQLVGAGESNGMLEFEVTRPFLSCDSANDLPIESGTTRIIWAYHAQDPLQETSIPMHQRMGSKSLNLLTGMSQKPVLGSDVKTIDLLITPPVAVPASEALRTRPLSSVH